jgi:hypothetical protein
MIKEKPIDDLIKAAWRVLDSDFDGTAFQDWTERALACLDDLSGPDHPYSERLRNRLRTGCEPAHPS